MKTGGMGDKNKISLAFSLPLILKFRFLSTRGPLGEYFRQTSLAIISPYVGQLGGGFLSASDSRAASCGSREYSSTLSTDIIWTNTQHMHQPQHYCNTITFWDDVSTQYLFWNDIWNSKSSYQNNKEISNTIHMSQL